MGTTAMRAWGVALAVAMGLAGVGLWGAGPAVAGQANGAECGNYSVATDKGEINKASQDGAAKKAGQKDAGVLDAALRAQFGVFNGLAGEPQDASLTFDDASGRYLVDPGRPYGKLDVDRAVAWAQKALESGKATGGLNALRERQEVTKDDARLKATCAAANTCLESDFDLQVQGVTVASVDDSVVRGWIVFGDDGSVALDEAAVTVWVDGVEAAIDNVGSARTYLRPDGKEVTVWGGDYGWISNGAETEALVLEAVSSGRAGALEIPMKQTAAVYNPGGADWGARYVDVDLTEQRARFYEADGTLVVETPVITGSVLQPGYETPQGVYSINDKALDVTLIGLPDPQTGEPSYEIPVDYWMPFVGNMIGLHDAPWQSWWSPEAYRSGAGSHGCVNLPVDTAAWCFEWVEIGTPIVVHY